jgi:sirohydrochlorin cobaltochelatase
MIVAGDHANNDMAGDDDDSWKSIFEAAGYQVECVLEGLGQLKPVRALIAEHAAEAIAAAK